MQESQLTIPVLPREVYKSSMEAPLQDEEIISYISEKIEYIPYEGILTYIQGATYFKRGFPTPESVAALNVAKTLLKELLKYKTFILLSDKNSILLSFNNVFDKLFVPYKVKKEFLCPVSYNIYRLILNILLKVGVSEEVAESFAYNCSHFLEYDDMYRYLFQDIISETTYNKLITSPRSEIERLMSIFSVRVGWKVGITAKINMLITPLSVLLLIPKYRKIFTESLTEDIFNGLIYTKEDRYWAYLKGDEYLFGGSEYHERTKDLQIPQAYKII